MKRFAVAFGLMAFAIGGILAADEKGLKELEGTYKLVHAERDGKAAEKALTDSATVTIQGDELVVAFVGDDKKTSKIKVNAEAKPATIELTPQDGKDKGKTFPGIYKIEKGEVTLAFSEQGDRPKEFKSDNEAILLRLKKVEKK
jgi:uncharacterized protein (TIGR03067 family)